MEAVVVYASQFGNTRQIAEAIVNGLGEWLDGLAPGSLDGVRSGAFDTRVKLFIHGDAAKKIEHALERAGAARAAEPSWFYVKGSEGPLVDGELERAEAWGRELAAA